MIKERNQCSSKSLSRNYLVSKFAELLKPVKINQFPFICETICGYEKSELDDQNDEISILSVCQRLSVKIIFKKYQKHFGQFANILPWCYLLDAIYYKVSYIDNVLQILHWMINQQHGESFFVLPFHSKIDLSKKVQKITSKFLVGW